MLKEIGSLPSWNQPLKLAILLFSLHMALQKATRNALNEDNQQMSGKNWGILMLWKRNLEKKSGKEGVGWEPCAIRPWDHVIACEK